MKGFPTELFETEPERFEVCSICLEVLNDPVMCSNSHTHCKTCIHTWMEVRFNCPLCLEIITPDSIIPNLYAKGYIGRKTVKCYVPELEGIISHADDICKWTGPLTSRPDHLDVCSFRQDVTCPIPMGKCLETCAGRYTRSALRNHLSDYGESNALKVNKLLQEKTGLEMILANTTAPGYATFVTRAEDRHKVTYCGQVIVGADGQQIKHGHGMTKHGWLWTYNGDYKNNLMHGNGWYKSEDFEYHGKWENDLCHGYCLYWTRGNGRRGSGHFRDNVMHGYGKIWNTVGYEGSYEGMFENDKKHGEGVWTNASGTKSFKGTFKNNKLCGEGVYTFPNKETLSGTFDGYCCSGVGTWRDGAGTLIRSGIFSSKNILHGEGEEHYPNGDIYKGSFVKGLRCGHGVLTFADKSEYTGMFFKDMMHGEGVMKSAVDGTCGERSVYVRGLFSEIV